MFGLSFPELLIVMVLALIVLGPERLPKVAKTIGKTMREVRRTTGQFKDLVEGEFNELDREVERMPERKPGPSTEAAAAVPAGAPLVRAAGALPAIGAADGVVARAHAAPELSDPAAAAGAEGIVAAAHAGSEPSAAAAAEGIIARAHAAPEPSTAADATAAPALAVGSTGLSADPTKEA